MNYLWKIVPSDKYTLIGILSGSMRIKGVDREIVRNDIILSQNFSLNFVIYIVYYVCTKNLYFIMKGILMWNY